MLVLGIVTGDLSLFPFHGLQASAEHCKAALFWQLIRFSALRYSPDLLAINNHDSDCQPSPKRQEQGLRRRTYIRGTRILTRFPFLYQPKLWAELGLTYPWLIYIAKEPLPFRWNRFSRF